MTTESYDSALTIQCDFITGSDAQGCVVVLVGEFSNSTVNLTRDGTCTVKTLTLNITLHEVFGLDIEYDGSIGTLPVPGVVTRNTASLCVPSKVTPQSSCEFLQSSLILHDVQCAGILLIASMAAVIFVVALVTVITIIYCKIKR